MLSLAEAPLSCMYANQKDESEVREYTTAVYSLNSLGSNLWFPAKLCLSHGLLGYLESIIFIFITQKETSF